MKYKIIAGGITLVVGYLLSSSSEQRELDDEEFEEVDEITLSEQGYNFEHERLKRLMNRVDGFESVEFYDANGAPLTPEIVDERFGSDGGVDCIIKIVTPTQHGANVVRGKLRKIIKTEDY